MSGSDTPETQAPAQAAILDATERLLARRGFSELAVSDIIAEAGVSRTSFYAHFGSRAAVLAACLRRVVDEVVIAVDPRLDESGDDPATAIRDRLHRWVDLAADHGPLLRTVSEQWPQDPELGELWTATISGFAAGTAETIERLRSDGRTPAGADAQALATVLMWGYERALHVALTGQAAGLPDPSSIVEPLTQMMLAGALGMAPR